MMTQSLFLEMISTWKQPSEKEPKIIIVCCFVKVERGEGDDCGMMYIGGGSITV